MIKVVLMLVTALAVSAGPAASALARQSAAPTLVGTVGPGFTIKLTQNGKAVKTLKHGTFKFVIHDKASIHSFSLNGPGGFSKAFTQVPFVGDKTSTVTLKAGKYTYFCPPHRTFMFGHLTVT